MALSFLDIKDASLLVPQQECVLVSMPTWWKPETHAMQMELTGFGSLNVFYLDNAMVRHVSSPFWLSTLRSWTL